jgi:hypothetical protein
MTTASRDVLPGFTAAHPPDAGNALPTSPLVVRAEERLTDEEIEDLYSRVRILLDKEELAAFKHVLEIFWIELDIL